MEIDDALLDVKRALKAPRGTRSFVLKLMDGSEYGVWAYPTDVPGMLVHRTLDLHGKWTLVLEASTWAVTRRLPSRKAAMSLAKRLAVAAPDIDWTVDGEALKEGYYRKVGDSLAFVPPVGSRPELINIVREAIAT